MAARKTKKVYLRFAFVIVSVFVLLQASHSFLTLENKYVDFLFKARLAFFGPQPVDPRLVVVAIDEASLTKFGKMPWPRKIWVEVLNKLMPMDPAVVAFDILFVERDLREPEQDQALVAITKKYQDKIIHAFFELVETIASGERFMPKVSVSKPFGDLLAATRYLGFVDEGRSEGGQPFPETDSDGAVRRAFTYKTTVESETALSLGTQIFARFKGLSVQDFAKRYPDEIYINFPGFDIRKTSSGSESYDKPYLRIGVADLLAGKVKKEELAKLKGSFVVIASLATGAFDHFPTAYEASTPGVEIHLYTLNSLIRGNYLRQAPGLVGVLVIILCGLVLALALERFSAGVNSILFFSMMAVLFGVSLYFFTFKNTIFNVLIPMVSCLSVFTSVTMYRFAVEEKEKRWIRATFSQYLSPKVVSLLVENPEALRLGGQKRDMSVLFLDIAHFTTISEKLPPEELTKMLNYYLTLFTEIILKYDGVVDKFIGDAIMAFWNAPLDQQDHAKNACLAALEIARVVQEKRHPSFPAITVRVGLNSGEMIVGNMGSSARLNYTVIGDNVNLASRLEGANKFFGTAILATEAIYEQAKESLSARCLGRVRVLGKATPVSVYEIAGRAENTQANGYHLWEDALSALQTGSGKEARKKFEAWLLAHPNDQVAMMYLKMIDEKSSQDFVINLEGK